MAGLFPLIWRPSHRIASVPGEPPAPSFRTITIMLTEFCNLDCWMCDFATSKGLKESIDWTPQRYIEFLTHPFFSQLGSIGFTGGEPFAYAGIQTLYAEIQSRFPSMFVSFSSNATLLKPMSETFDLTRDWARTKLFSSIDGVETHDVQRGKVGAFAKSMAHLSKLREKFPALGIDIKFTLTPINHHELKAAFLYCTERGFNFTAKMVENNPYYTAVLSSASRDAEFTLDAAQLRLVHEQLECILGLPSARLKHANVGELRELLESLDPAWRRTGKCSTPTQSAFLDARLNFSCCKEYPPVLNVGRAALDELPHLAGYRDVIAYEAANAQACTRCTSQLKRRQTPAAWARWLG